MKVYRSLLIDAPIERVWAAVRNFDGVAAWNPGVATATLKTGTPTQIGAVRRLEIVDGTVFKETLLAHSDLDHFYTYDIIESPLPVQHYVSTHRFVPVTHSQQTLGIWESNFECAPEVAQEMEKTVGDQIYINAMLGLCRFLEG